MILPLLTLLAAPEPLPQRFVVDSAGPGALVAFAGPHEVITAAGKRLRRHALADGAVVEDVTLPCDAVDLYGHRDGWGALCRDRLVVVSRRMHEVKRYELRFTARPPAQHVALNLFFGKWAVSFADGTVAYGSLGERAVHDVKLPASAAALAIGMDKPAVALVDGRYGDAGAGALELADEPATPPTVARIVDGGLTWEGMPDFEGGRARGAPVVDGGGRVAFAMGSTRADFDMGREIIACTTGATRLECYGAAPDGTRGPHADGAEGEPVVVVDIPPPAPPADLLAPGALVIEGATAAGALSLAAAPFALYALSPSVPAGAAAAVGALALVVSAGTLVAAGAVAVVVTGIVMLAVSAATADDVKRASGCGIVDGFADAMRECACVFAALLVSAAAVVGAAGVGVAVLGALAMPGVDAALGGRAPAGDPLLPTLGGAVAGGALGLTLSTLWGLSAGALQPVDEDHPESDQQRLVDGLVQVQGALHIVGFGAAGAAVGYGLARGPS